MDYIIATVGINHALVHQIISRLQSRRREEWARMPRMTRSRVSVCHINHMARVTCGENIRRRIELKASGRREGA